MPIFDFVCVYVCVSMHLHMYRLMSLCLWVRINLFAHV